MRVYFNTSALNRPLDDLSSERVRLEAEAVVGLLAAVEARARGLERVGFRGLDALHMASAEAGGAELLITTDDRMIRQAVRAGRDLRVRPVTPPEAVALLS